MTTYILGLWDQNDLWEIPDTLPLNLQEEAEQPEPWWACGVWSVTNLCMYAHVQDISSQSWGFTIKLLYN